MIYYSKSDSFVINKAAKIYSVAKFILFCVALVMFVSSSSVSAQTFYAEFCKSSHTLIFKYDNDFDAKNKNHFAVPNFEDESINSKEKVKFSWNKLRNRVNNIVFDNSFTTNYLGDNTVLYSKFKHISSIVSSEVDELVCNNCVSDNESICEGDSLIGSLVCNNIKEVIALDTVISMSSFVSYDIKEDETLDNNNSSFVSNASTSNEVSDNEFNSNVVSVNVDSHILDASEDTITNINFDSKNSVNCLESNVYDYSSSVNSLSIFYNNNIAESFGYFDSSSMSVLNNKTSLNCLNFVDYNSLNQSNFILKDFRINLLSNIIFNDKLFTKSLNVVDFTQYNSVKDTQSNFVKITQLNSVENTQYICINNTQNYIVENTQLNYVVNTQLNRINNTQINRVIDTQNIFVGNTQINHVLNTQNDCMKNTQFDFVESTQNKCVTTTQLGCLYNYNSICKANANLNYILFNQVDISTSKCDRPFNNCFCACCTQTPCDLNTNNLKHISSLDLFVDNTRYSEENVLYTYMIDDVSLSYRANNIALPLSYLYSTCIINQDIEISQHCGNNQYFNEIGLSLYKVNDCHFDDCCIALNMQEDSPPFNMCFLELFKPDG